MEDVFVKLEKEGKNDVDNLVNWMKEAKIVENNEAALSGAKAAFNEVVGTGKVNIQQFKEVLGKLAAKGSMNVEQMSSKLAAEGNAVLAGLAAAAGALLNPK